MPVTVSDNVMGHIWMKFVLNAAINPVSAMTGLRPGEIARVAAARELLERVLDEVLAVVAAKGVTLPVDDPRGHVLDHAWERYNRPSMLQHIEEGRRTEIDALNGALLKEAKAVGRAVPVQSRRWFWRSSRSKRAMRRGRRCRRSMKRRWRPRRGRERQPHVSESRDP